MKHLRTLFLLTILGLSWQARAASTLYAATKTGPFKSTDSGVTWKQLIVTSNDSSLPGQPEVFSIVVDPQTTSTVYAFARFGPNGQTLAFIKSTDSGANWSVVSKPTFSYTYGTAALLAIDPVKTNVLYTMNASDGLEITTDGGVTWIAPTIPKPPGSPSGGTANQPGLHGVRRRSESFRRGLCGRWQFGLPPRQRLLLQEYGFWKYLDPSHIDGRLRQQDFYQSEEQP